MKIRNGFVSNSSSTSSSTSFIIVYKDGAACPHCGRKDPNIVDMIKNISNDDTYLRYEGLENVLSDFTADIDIEERAEIKISLEKYISEGWEAASISISDHDEDLRDLFNAARDNGSVVSLWSNA